MGMILFNTFFAPMMGVEPNQKNIEAGGKYLHAQLPVIETQLGETTFLAGNEMSLADITMIAAMEPFEHIKFDISMYPNIVAWRQNIMQQGFYQKVHAHYGAELSA